MKAKIKDRTLTIDLDEFANSLSDEDRREFAKYVTFENTLMEGVCDTVASGTAFEGGWWSMDLTERLRLKLLPLMPTVVRKLVERLLEDRARLKDESAKYHQALFDLLHKHWPKHIPEPPVERRYHGRCDYLTQDEADAWLAKQLPDGEWEAIKETFAPAQEPEAVS